MISQREFIRRYSARENKAEKADPDFAPTVQKFECRFCKTVLNVKKEIPGITPEVLQCSNCSQMQIIQKEPGENPTHEWGVPNPDATWKLRRKAPGLLEHILNGGLLIYEIEKNESKRSL